MRVAVGCKISTRGIVSDCVQVAWNGVVVARDVDLWSGPTRRIAVREVDLGERDLSQPVELRFTVTGHAAANEAPHHYFGVDCVLVR